MATSSSDCGDNGYCLYEWDSYEQLWRLYENKAAEGFVCVTPSGGDEMTPDGTLVLTCAEPASA